jgi:hypothetical protein
MVQSVARRDRFRKEAGKRGKSVGKLIVEEQGRPRALPLDPAGA